MDGWGRRIRGAIGIGLSWAAGWGVVGAVLWVGLSVWFPSVFSLVPSVLSSAIVLGVLGFGGGATFSVVFAVAEGRRRFDELSLPRFTWWGAVGGSLLGAVVVAGDLVQIAEVHAGRSYQSHYGTRLHFGLGAADEVAEIRVDWPDGTVTIESDEDAGQIVRLSPP